MSAETRMRVLLAVLALAWWGWLILGAWQWYTRHRVRATQRPDHLPRTAWAFSWVVARTLREPILWTAGSGALGIVLAAVRWPVFLALGDATVVLWAGWKVHRWRLRVRRETPVRHLRAALVDVQGRDAQVRTEGRRDDGAPERVTIRPGQGWKHWKPDAQNELAHAITHTLPGDWSRAEHQPDGTSVWERAPELPERVDYPGPGRRPSWRKVPVGVDGRGKPAALDFGVPHWLIAGSTGSGKTSYLRVIGAHLLAAGCDLVALDPNRVGLSFLEGRPGVRSAMGEHTTIARMLAELVVEMQSRLTELERTRRRPAPLVVLVDETEAFLADDKRHGRSAGESSLLQLARQGRKVQLHLVLATQRPDAKALPTSLRDLCMGRIAVGPLSEQGAKMMLDADAEQAQRTLGVKGRAVLRSGDLLTPVQGYWLPDPDDLDTPAQQRQAAEQWLPARVKVPQASDRVDAHVDAGTPIERAAPAPSTRASAEPRLTLASSNGAAGKTERQSRYRARLLERLTEDPADPRHGRPAGRQAGCHCQRCRPVNLPAREEA